MTSIPAATAPGSAAQRALMLSFHDPQATTYGGGQRTHLLAKALGRYLALDVVWFVEDSQETKVTRLPPEFGGGNLYQLGFRIQSVADTIWLGTPSPYLTALLAQHVTVQEYDVIVCRYIQTYIKITLPKNIPVLVDFDDPVYQFYFSNTRSPKALLKEMVKWAHQFWVRARLKYLPSPPTHFLFVSQRDAHRFPYLEGSLLPNIAVKPALAKQSATGDGKTLLFVGYMAWQPNRDGVNRFLKQIWPHVLAAVPDAHFRIVGGASPAQLESWRKHLHCEAPGFVKDLTTEYQRAALCVVPLYSGGGSNIKLVEAAAHGCPVVASQYAFEGWRGYFKPGVDVVVADSDKQFAAACIQLLQSPQEAAELASRGNRFVVENLSFEVFCARVGQSLSSMQIGQST